MAPGALGQQTWPRRVARGVMLADSLRSVSKKGSRRPMLKTGRGRLAVTSPRLPLGGARSEWGLLGTFAHEDGWVNGEVLAMPGSLSCESVAHGPAAG
jgi:hypothetical protein